MSDFATFEITGRTDNDGNPLFAGIDRWENFFREWPNRSFVIQVTVVEPYTEDHITWFYVKTILPALQKRMASLGEPQSISEIDEMLRDKFGALEKPEEKSHRRIFDFDRWEPAHECTYTEQVLFVEYVNKFSAEYLNLLLWQPT